MSTLRKSKVTKVLSLVVGVLTAFVLTLGVGATSARALTTDETIAQLLAQIQALTAQINSLSGGTTTTVSCNFTVNLSQGMTHSEAKMLQQFLNASADTRVAASGAGSPGMETNYMGALTVAAVKKFQAKYASEVLAGLPGPTGYWGPKSRAKANALCTTTLPPVPPPGATGTVSVTAGSQPVNSLAPQSSSRVPFTRISVRNNGTAAVTINGVNVRRTGLGANAVFSGINLVDEGTTALLGSPQTLNSNNEATVGGAFTINAGETKNLVVVGNMATDLSSYTGQIVSLTVLGLNTSASVSGNLPVTGASHTINSSLSIGSVTVNTSTFDPVTNQTRNIGDTAIKMSGVRVTAGSAEDLRLMSIRWRLNGTVSASDISNVMTYVDGTAYPTMLSADGRYYTTVFPGGILIAKGFSKDVYVQADITGTLTAGRTVQFDIDRNSDLYLVGQTFGYGIAPALGSGTCTSSTDDSTFCSSNNPYFHGSTFTINGASATTIGRATEVASQNVAANVPNVTLGGFVTDLRGEGLNVTSLSMTVSTSTGATGGKLTNVSIFNASGAVVAGPIDASTNGSTLSFTSTINFPVGRQVYTVKGTIPSAWANNSTVYLSTTPSGWTATGQITGNSVTLSQGSFDMSTMTVKGASLSMNMSSQPASQNIVAGSQGVTFANVQLDATASGEDIRVSSIILALTGTVADLSSCQVFDGTVALNTGSNVPSSLASTGSANTITFDNSLTVTKGTVKTLTLKCNVSSAASGTYVWDLTSGDYGSFSATGLSSGNSLTTANGRLTVAAGGAQNAGTMTVASGSFSVAVDPSSPSYTVVAVGSAGVSGQTSGIVRLRASNENVSLQKLGLTLTNSDGSTAYNSVTRVDIYDGATKVGSAFFTGTNETATSTLDIAVTLNRDTDKLLTLKAELAGISTSQTGTPGLHVKVDPLNAQGVGLGSGNTVNVSATGNTAGYRTFKSTPTIAIDSLGTTGIADGRLMRFRVSASSMGPVGIFQFKFKFATTSATLTNIELYAYTDASYSSPVSGQGTSGQIGSTLSAPTYQAFNTFAASSNAVQVPAGGTLYFELRGSVSGVVSGSSVVTTLGGDSAYQTNLTSGYYVSTSSAATSTSNFVWSGNSTTTASYGDVDWSNGYGITGLPSAGLIQTRSN